MEIKIYYKEGGNVRVIRPTYQISDDGYPLIEEYQLILDERDGVFSNGVMCEPGIKLTHRVFPIRKELVLVDEFEQEVIDRIEESGNVLLVNDGEGNLVPPNDTSSIPEWIEEEEDY